MIFTHKKKTVEERGNGLSKPADEKVLAPITADEMTKEESKLKTQYSQYENNYSDSNFKIKIASTAKKLGEKITSEFLLVYHLLIDNDSPVKPYQKALIIGVLGYFILPIDVIPDYIPGAGLVDDGAALAALIASFEKVLEADIIRKFKARAAEQSEKYFGGK